MDNVCCSVSPSACRRGAEVVAGSDGHPSPGSSPAWPGAPNPIPVPERFIEPQRTACRLRTSAAPGVSNGSILHAFSVLRQASPAPIAEQDPVPGAQRRARGALQDAASTGRGTAGVKRRAARPHRAFYAGRGKPGEWKRGSRTGVEAKAGLGEGRHRHPIAHRADGEGALDKRASAHTAWKAPFWEIPASAASSGSPDPSLTDRPSAGPRGAPVLVRHGANCMVRAGDGNRTRVSCLEGRGFTTKLLPPKSAAVRPKAEPTRPPACGGRSCTLRMDSTISP